MSYIEIFTVHEIRQIAQVCHEANRAFCETTGDFSQRPWHECETWQRESAIAGVIHAVDPHADTLTPATMHQKWCDDKRNDGWVYGPVKDAAQKTHPCLVPYYELPSAQRFKDTLFLAVVDAFVDHASEHDDMGN